MEMSDETRTHPKYKHMPQRILGIVPAPLVKGAIASRTMYIKLGVATVSMVPHIRSTTPHPSFKWRPTATVANPLGRMMIRYQSFVAPASTLATAA
eukprot:6482030-Amphidinium_carterae.1